MFAFVFLSNVNNVSFICDMQYLRGTVFRPCLSRQYLLITFLFLCFTFFTPFQAADFVLRSICSRTTYTLRSICHARDPPFFFFFFRDDTIHTDVGTPDCYSKFYIFRVSSFHTSRVRVFLFCPHTTSKHETCRRARFLLALILLNTTEHADVHAPACNNVIIAFR